MNKRTKFCIVAMIAIILYTAICLVATFLGKTVPDSLTIAYFSAWTVELALLYGIKIKNKE